MDIVVFLPIRKGSQRIKDKNTKKFSGINGGLTFIKISQLLKSKRIDQIIISTNDKNTIKIANSFKSRKITIDNRPEYLATSDTSTDDLINYVPKIIQNSIVLWTHVTSPFVDEKLYDNMIEKYLQNSNNYDSLMSVTKVQKFIWDNNSSINYDRKKEKWPRTQTIQPLYEINSGAFIASTKIYEEFKDRIGKKTYLFELNEKEAFDIDWENDFEIAEILWSKYGKI